MLKYSQLGVSAAVLLVPRARLRETFKMREHGEESGIAEGLQRGDARIAQRREGVVDKAAGGPVEGGWAEAAARSHARVTRTHSSEFARVRAAEPQGLVQAHDGCVRCGMRRGSVGSGVGRGTPGRNERRVGRREGLWARTSRTTSCAAVELAHRWFTVHPEKSGFARANPGAYRPGRPPL